MDILAQIVRDKRVEIARRRTELPLAGLLTAARKRTPAPAFSAALCATPMGLIAEVKRRSPSAGPIREPFDPPEIAKAYESAGASAISVLMDEKYFGGGEADFKTVRAAVRLPLLYKEFVIDEWQVAHAATLGASAILLIAAVLTDAEIHTFSAQAKGLGLEILLEVHDEAEMRRAEGLQAPLIGVNNRDLRTFRTDIGTTLLLAPLAPAGAVLVSESGIRSAADIRRLQKAGVRGVLAGEQLLRRPDVAGAVRELLS